MASPIIGYNGTVTVSNGSSSVGVFINSWEASLELDEKTIGPFLNDGGTLYSYIASRKLRGKIEATVPSGRDPAQSLLVSGAVSGATLFFDFQTTNGYRIQASGVASNFSMNQDASDTPKMSFEFGSVGTFNITPLAG